MTEPTVDIVKLIGLFITISVVGWGVVKWLLGRIDATGSNARLYTDEKHRVAMDYADRVDSRVNDVKDEYVKRTELDRDFQALEKQIDSMNRAIAEGRAETNQRLDRMLMLLGKVISNHSTDHLD